MQLEQLATHLAEYQQQILNADGIILVYITAPEEGSEDEGFAVSASGVLHDCIPEPAVNYLAGTYFNQNPNSKISKP